MPIGRTLLAAWRGWWSPYFKDSKSQPLWAALLVTFLFSAVIGLALTAFSWVFSAGRIDFGRTLWVNFVVAECIGFSIHGVFMLAGVLLGAERIDNWTGLHRRCPPAGRWPRARSAMRSDSCCWT
ncbi:MAG: hypothetical protein U5L03_02830 [Burkholderiaceae bacterium]|nr:hypothetical protein [Burkholderiaceae bacterium]